MDKEALHDLWRYLHTHPEVSWEEHETTAYLMDLFEKAGLHPVAFQKIPGFYVDVGQGKPLIGLRADMDALFQEVDGVPRANHSCGHDGHMAMVTAVMLRLKEEAASLKGTVRAIFQPAEELGSGAIKVVEEGAVDGMDYLFGVHVRPKNEIAFPACAPGISHGACLFVKGEIKGMDHHGARPHEGVNAIEVGASLLQHIKQIHPPPMIPASVKMTNFHAGTDNLNIIPGDATFGLDVRAQTNDVMHMLKEKIRSICKHVSTLYGSEIIFEFDDDVPAAVINEEAEHILAKAIENSLGADALQERILTSGSDDFHYYTLLRPQIKATMLALGADVEPGLHHPHMTFNKQALENGTAILLETCLLLLAK